MNERTLRPANVAAGVLTLGGMLIVLRPEHTLGIVQLMLLAVAAAAGLHALVVSVPTAWWTSPFTARDGGDEGVDIDDMDRLRAALSGPRQPVENGPPLPGATLHLLQPLVEVALERRGLDPRDPADLKAAKALLSPRARAVLAADPWNRPAWYRMRRPDEAAVAEIVHDLLDELARLTPGSVPSGAPDSAHPRAT